MANRATEQEVKAIFDTTLTDEQITPFLNAANVLVDDVLVGEDYAAALLKEIECWLAAHLASARDPRVTEEKIDDAQTKFQGKFGEGLKATAYGQQVLLLDHHGKFATVSIGKGGAIVETIA